MCTISMMYGHEFLQSVSIVSIELAAFNWYMAIPGNGERLLLTLSASGGLDG